jgi:hypothetical protein
MALESFSYTYHGKLPQDFLPNNDQQQKVDIFYNIWTNTPSHVLLTAIRFLHWIGKDNRIIVLSGTKNSGNCNM